MKIFAAWLLTSIIMLQASQLKELNRYLRGVQLQARIMDTDACRLAINTLLNWRPTTRREAMLVGETLAAAANVCESNFLDRRVIEERAWDLIVQAYPQLISRGFPAGVCPTLLFNFRRDLLRDKDELEAFGVSSRRARARLLKSSALILHKCKSWMPRPQRRLANDILVNGYN